MKNIKKIYYIIIILAIFNMNTARRKNKDIKEKEVIEISKVEEKEVIKELKEEEKEELKEEGRYINENEFVRLDNYYKKLKTENLNEDFFIGKIENVKDIIMTKEDIIKFNFKNFENCNMLYDLSEYLEVLKFEKIKAEILSLSSPSKSIRYKKDGNKLTKNDYNILYKNLNIDNIDDNEDVNIKFGISVNRTIMKTYPTDMKISVNPGDIAFDRFTETAVYPCEIMAVLHESKDKKWSFVQMYNYKGWVKNEDIAFASKSDVLNYFNSSDYIVVTESQIEISFYNEEKGEIDNISYDMGVKIKIDEMAETEKYFLGYIPLKDKNGNLKFTTINLNKKYFNKGYLPYTKENIVKQSFKFIGNYYGWGGLNNSRDCSAFVMDIYRTFGIMLPRNSSEQGKYSLGKTVNFTENENIDVRIKKLDTLKTGAALYMPGHVMIYLGKYNNQYYIIHSFTGYYRNENFIEVMKTSLSTLDIKSKDGKMYIEKLYAGKEYYLD